MKISTNLVAVLALITFATPAFARHDDDRHFRDRGHRYSNKHHKNVHKRYKHRYKQQRRAAVQQAKWNWNGHNWNQQRDYVHSNWQSRSARINAAQRAQLDAQLRPQWQAYNTSINPNWNASYDWNSYNDPQFLDYVHNRNPSVLTQIRNVLGF